jgi:hypothetical protein
LATFPPLGLSGVNTNGIAHATLLHRASAESKFNYFLCASAQSVQMLAVLKGRHQDRLDGRGAVPQNGRHTQGEEASRPLPVRVSIKQKLGGMVGGDNQVFNVFF